MLIKDPISLWVILTPDPPMTVQVSGQDALALKTCSFVRGLLVGTSASPLGNLGRDVLRKLKSGLEKGLDTFHSTLERESLTDDL